MRPNILFILSDDQGPWALGCAGNEEIQTPHLDRLAAEGTRFENFFCVSPVCSPARASLLTGTIPSAHGVHDWLAGQHAGEGAVDYLEGQRIVTDEFSDAGYRVGLIGKLHLGASDRPRPGFDHWVALEGGGSQYREATVYRGRGSQCVAQAEHVTDYLTDFFADEAIAFLEDDDERPYFLSLNFTAPHKPWKGQHPEEFERLYENCAFASSPQEDPHPWLAQRDGVAIASEPDTRAALVGYYAAVSAMDAAIGRVLSALERTDCAQNTIVVFTSDNGFNCGHHGVWGKGNGTFPQNMYDSSVKVPFIVRDAGTPHPGRVVSHLVSAYDVPATLLELAGLDASAFECGPGLSFAPLVYRYEPIRERPVVVFDEYGPTRMIRTDAEKYVHRYPFGPHEYYDLLNDPNERDNLVADAAHAERVQGLRSQMDAWFTRHGVAAADGARLPVTGGGQIDRVAARPLDAFLARD